MLTPTTTAMRPPKTTISPSFVYSCVVNTLEALTDWYQ